MSEKLPTDKSHFESREKPLRRKVALITGASRDIGAWTAKALGKEGVTIIGCFRDKAKRANLMQEELTALGISSEFLQADITVPEDRQKLRQAAEKYEKLDFLILNASGPTTEVNVTAANALIDIFLPIMPRDSTIVQMQSVPGHFEPQLKGKIPEFYRPVAEAKHLGEDSVRARIPEFEQKGIDYIVICPPEVPDTSNMKLFARIDPDIHKQNAELSKNLGLPETITMEKIGEKIAQLAKRKDLPLGYVEFFKE